MDRGKKPVRLLEARNSKIYMDLKDIIRENALPFVPAKSLLRFRAVCRDWKLQISTPFFAHNQSNRSRAILGIFCQAVGEPPLFISLDPSSCGVPDPLFRFLPVPVEVRSSCNGLVCCQAKAGDKAYYICNPVTQQWKKLPQPSVDHGESSVVLAFEPSLLNFEADYKLICTIRSADFDDAIEFEIFSSKEGCWKIAGEILFAGKSVLPRSGVYINGIVYWSMTDYVILAYDVTKDRSQTFQRWYGSPSGSMGSVNGKLCIPRVNNREISLNVLDNVHSNTMQMGSNSRMWKQLNGIVPNSEVLEDDQVQQVVFVGGDVLVFQGRKRLYCHDLKTAGTKVLSCPSITSKIRCVPYVNSLVGI